MRYGWIIPARAGFTTWRSSAARSHGDHPRSRGVYLLWHFHRLMGRGSSPLARGLRHASPPDRDSQQDHPRSRGVYWTWRWAFPICPGSSPLARGLLGPRILHAHEEGIIPARAGFTRGRMPAGAGRPDHPRSRGVYSSETICWGRGSGSSPLARGLLIRIVLSFRCTGIIPARAGFTR